MADERSTEPQTEQTAPPVTPASTSADASPPPPESPEPSAPAAQPGAPAADEPAPAALDTPVEDTVPAPEAVAPLPVDTPVELPDEAEAPAPVAAAAEPPAEDPGPVAADTPATTSAAAGGDDVVPAADPGDAEAVPSADPSDVTVEPAEGAEGGDSADPTPPAPAADGGGDAPRGERPPKAKRPRRPRQDRPRAPRPKVPLPFDELRAAATAVLRDFGGRKAVREAYGVLGEKERKDLAKLVSEDGEWRTRARNIAAGSLGAGRVGKALAAQQLSMAPDEDIWTVCLTKEEADQRFARIRASKARDEQRRKRFEERNNSADRVSKEDMAKARDGRVGAQIRIVQGGTGRDDRRREQGDEGKKPKKPSVLDRLGY